MLPPLCRNCGEYRQWCFVEEDIDLALCAGCLICVPRRAGVMECRSQEVREVAEWSMDTNVTSAVLLERGFKL